MPEKERSLRSQPRSSPHWTLKRSARIQPRSAKRHEAHPKGCSRSAAFVALRGTKPQPATTGGEAVPNLFRHFPREVDMRTRKVVHNRAELQRYISAMNGKENITTTVYGFGTVASQTVANMSPPSSLIRHRHGQEPCRGEIGNGPAEVGERVRQGGGVPQCF